MRQLIMWNLMTLDGLFDGPKPWELDWHLYVWGDELERFSLEQAATADTLVFGRKTYEGMAAYWTTAEGDVADFMNSVRKVVFSRTLDAVTWSNSVLAGDAPEVEVARLKEEPGKSILIFGSADLSATLMRHGLVDEYRLGVVPVVLGSGVPLFKPADERMRMTLVDSTPLESGCVILRYRPRVDR